MYVFAFLCITLFPFQFYNHLEEEEKVGCFAIIVLQVYFYYECTGLFLTVPSVVL